MPKLILTIDGVVIKEALLTKERTTLGRRPYNDVVIDNLAVSGEHAVLHLQGASVEVEDLGSTNGTYVNGKSIKRQALHNGDVVDVGRYKLRFVQNPYSDAADSARMGLSALNTGAAALSANGAQPTPPKAGIQVLNGVAAGREVPLTKVVTTLGKPGVAVASITRRHMGYVLNHIEGESPTLLNGSPIGFEPTPLKEGDVLELAGTQMRFTLASA